jgi:phosphoribosylformylglycinamidine synthase II
MIWRVEIQEKANVYDASGEGVHHDIRDLGITCVNKVRVVYVYNIDGDISAEQTRTICEELLSDKITQEFSFCPAQDYTPSHDRQSEIVEIAYLPGVMDPVEASTMKGIRDLGISGVKAVRTAKQYSLSGNITQKELNIIIEKVLSNKLIQQVVRRDQANAVTPLVMPTSTRGSSAVVVHTIDLRKAKAAQLTKISQDGQLFLNLKEMQAIQKHFRCLGRDPTDCELETIAQTWSEHCHHKTFRGRIRYRSRIDGKVKTQIINNLLKSTIMKATRKLNKSWCVSVFHDNAGVIKFDEDTNVCFKVETHNHPSALEPFGGANTGIGGVIRDILGTGLGAKPICNTDVFCFAPPDFPSDKLPAGTFHPKRIMKGVVAGVRDYGNKMGIPTVNGAILFDDQFVGNPLVYCGTVGVIPKGKEIKTVSQGDVIVVVGGRTGRDGIHGATFSSGELTHESEVVSSGAVQIGDPIQEKKMLDVLLQARDLELYAAVTDCGAGGLSSAVGEMGEELGARVNLEKVPLKYLGLTYREIWISESQERMVLAVHPQNINRLFSVFHAENVEATAIGEFTGTGRLELFYQGTEVADLDMDFLHKGIPQITKKASWTQPKMVEPKIVLAKDLTKNLLEVLSHYNVSSKEWVIRQYDHEVQGGSTVKALVGTSCDGPSDAAVITPKIGSARGIAIANGINVRYGQVDPYWMAASCIDEAIRQIVAIGGNPERIALLDNFCWGNPDKPDRLGGLVRCAQACYKFALDYGVPFISGKDSLYNEYTQGRQTIAIPGTILISALGIIEDVTKCVTMDLKQAGNYLYIVGPTSDELGGSIYYDVNGSLGSRVPKVHPQMGKKIFQKLHAAVQNGLVRSLHDCSEGGLGAALAEMAFAGGLGATIFLAGVPYHGKEYREDVVLFSETNSRFLVEVTPQEHERFERQLRGIDYGFIGRVETSPEFVVYGFSDKVCVNVYIQDLKEAWQKPLRW